MRVLVFGAGWLGNRLANDIKGALLLPTDICDGGAVLAALDHFKPDAAVNAAGKTGRPNVDWCEAHRGETVRSNVTGAMILAEACEARGVHLLHLGSGCIFYGKSPHPDGSWREGDAPNPESWYSRTKAAADILLSVMPHVAAVRLRMPIDSAPHPRNLITKLAGYRQVIDVENSVTVVDDLVRAVARLIEVRGTGVFHAVNTGTMRHRDLLAMYGEVVDPMHSCEFIDEGDLVARGIAVGRRSNCALADTRLAAHGVVMRPIDEALRRTMEAYAAAWRAGGERVGSPHER